ncbi:iron ABC transporter substrate-binding protein [Sporanaerobium hydrogeniformans]|uniref:Iron ABC transporter substrate-binding protein n=1 Tax=Sporanaerobium hydrogeniformans TaxID=3072179 RepID=A0AC61DEZ8_9FIRM|nr:ABC transporter substrate-binding protein [Sporanaerobium hydrogeniformans]PHV71393.1 iron ABC transporter substrate-binding protein [Sporanaerobium hydrogeniformans]
MSKKIVSLLLSLVIIGTSLVGCANNNTSTDESQASAPIENVQASSKPEQNEATVTVVDQLGRTVEFPREINRIVSSYYISSSLLIALGAEDKVVGLEMKADTREIYKKAAPEFLELPGVGTSKSISVEETLALKPDLVILPYRLEEFVEQFEALNIPIIVVEPESMDQFLECITLIGKAIGEEERAGALLSYYEEKIGEIRQLTEGLEERPRVYMSGGSSAFTTCTANMYQNDLIHLAGGQNVSEELTDGYWANVSAEQILAWDPEFIFNVNYASYDKSELTGDAQLTSVSAIKEERVYTFPSVLEAWDYPTPSSILGILWLTQKLHPELYSVEAYTKDAQDFYKTFYDIEITQEDMGL